jgi:hypothetical protein
MPLPEEHGLSVDIIDHEQHYPWLSSDSMRKVFIVLTPPPPRPCLIKAAGVVYQEVICFILLQPPSPRPSCFVHLQEYGFSVNGRTERLSAGGKAEKQFN